MFTSARRRTTPCASPSPDPAAARSACDGRCLAGTAGIPVAALVNDAESRLPCGAALWAARASVAATVCVAAMVKLWRQWWRPGRAMRLHRRSQHGIVRAVAGLEAPASPRSRRPGDVRHLRRGYGFAIARSGASSKETCTIRRRRSVPRRSATADDHRRPRHHPGVRDFPMRRATASLRWPRNSGARRDRADSRRKTPPLPAEAAHPALEQISSWPALYGLVEQLSRGLDPTSLPISPDLPGPNEHMASATAVAGRRRTGLGRGNPRRGRARRRFPAAEQPPRIPSTRRRM